MILDSSVGELLELCDASCRSFGIRCRNNKALHDLHVYIRICSTVDMDPYPCADTTTNNILTTQGYVHTPIYKYLHSQITYIHRHHHGQQGHDLSIEARTVH